MVFVLQLIVDTITVKISVGFFRLPSNSKEFKKWDHFINRLKFNSLIDTNVIAIVKKKPSSKTMQIYIEIMLQTPKSQNISTENLHLGKSIWQLIN